MKAIKTYRLKRGMTQEELAEKSGISRQTIITLESNKKANVTVGVLRRIATALGVPVSAFFKHQTSSISDCGGKEK